MLPKWYERIDQEIDTIIRQFNDRAGFLNGLEKEVHHHGEALAGLNGQMCVLGWHMNGTSINKKKDDHPKEGLKATLEKKYIEEYLLSRGYRRKDLQGLRKEVAKQLMIEACTYASLKLVNIESRAHFRKMFHGSS